jgi:putative transposase
VTICTEHRRLLLADPMEARRVISHLLTHAAQNDFLLHAFCAMPDHLHFLAEGTTDDSDLLRLVGSFKQRTGFEYRRHSTATLWQKRFFDYILRRSDAIEAVACYIWMNAVRRNLCASPEQYAFSGSQTIDWMKRASGGPRWLPPWRNGAPGSSPAPTQASTPTSPDV